MSQPFSGIFGTYLLPNNNPDPEIRLKQLSEAIKLVFSSIYSRNARTYFEAINYKVEQEKMAIVIQSVVGNRFEDAFYPHISGTAQSFNFYPVAHMTPQDGFAVMAVGLGQYVVEGERLSDFHLHILHSILFHTKIFIKIHRFDFMLLIWQKRI